jgi:hypothetical protein
LPKSLQAKEAELAKIFQGKVKDSLLAFVFTVEKEVENNWMTTPEPGSNNGIAHTAMMFIVFSFTIQDEEIRMIWSRKPSFVP